MKISQSISILVVGVFAGTVFAASGGSWASAGRAISSGAKSSPSRSPNSTSSSSAYRPSQAQPAPSKARPGYSASGRPINRQLGTAPRRSLIDSDGPKPSPQVTQIIQTRESSGPGWLGTAFLISMLSRHDLSSADKRWVQDRINALRGEGEKDALLPPVHPKIRFSFAGMDKPLLAGEKAVVSVSALDGVGRSIPVACELPAKVDTPQGVRAVLAWTPEAPGVMMITCKAGGSQDRRLLRVVAKG